MLEPSSRATDRHRATIDRALGELVAQALVNDDVTDILLDPSGSLWLDRHSRGLEDTSETLTPGRADIALRSIAGLLETTITPEHPILEGELPFDGSRIAGVLPPVAPAPAFAIRKRARRTYSLAEYIDSRVLNDHQAAALRAGLTPFPEARRLLFTDPEPLPRGGLQPTPEDFPSSEAEPRLRPPQNLVISGGPGSGKTTLANALLAEMVSTAVRAERYLLIEDTRELRCDAPSSVALRTTDTVGLRELVRLALRFRPDRILVGEVRGAEALDLLKAWNTGTPGGLATVHANSARDALTRLDQLVQEANVPSQRELVAQAVDLIVHIERVGSARRVRELLYVDGVDREDRFITHPVHAPEQEDFDARLATMADS